MTEVLPSAHDPRDGPQRPRPGGAGAATREAGRTEPRAPVTEGTVVPRALPAVVAAPKAELERRRLKRALLHAGVGFLVALALHVAAVVWLYTFLAERRGTEQELRIQATLDEILPAETYEEPTPPPEDIEPPEEIEPEIVDVPLDEPSDEPYTGEIGPTSMLGLGGGGGGGGGLRRPIEDALPQLGGGDDPFGRFVAEIRSRGLDVVFVVDATASMDVFIAQARAVLDEVIDDLTAVALDVRLGIVAYRDRSDAWLTRAVPLTSDRYRVHNFLMDLRAEGGGDWEEAVDEGLRVAIEEGGWRDEARRVIILVGDAPVHEEREPDALALVRAFARSRHALVNVLFTGSDPGRMPTEREELARAAMRRITQTGGGLLAEMQSGDVELRRRITDATFGPEWADDVAALLSSSEVSSKERFVRARISRGDRAWLLGELGRDRGETRPIIVEGCIALFDATIARGALALVLDESRPRPTRSAALYVLKRSPLVRAEIDVDAPLAGQQTLVARAVNDVEALEATARREGARGPPPAPPPGAGGGG